MTRGVSISSPVEFRCVSATSSLVVHVFACTGCARISCTFPVFMSSKSRGSLHCFSLLALCLFSVHGVCSIKHHICLPWVLFVTQAKHPAKSKVGKNQDRQMTHEQASVMHDAANELCRASPVDGRFYGLGDPDCNLVRAAGTLPP